MAVTLRDQVARHSVFKKETGCRLWTGTLSNGKPIAWVEDEFGRKKGVYIQRYLVIKKFNLASNKQYSITTTCGNPNCLNKDHLELTTRKRMCGYKTQNSRRGRLVGNMKHNKLIFETIVKNSRDVAASVTGLTIGTVVSILNNKAMLPFFQYQIEKQTGASSIHELKALSDKELRDKGLGKLARALIRSEEAYRLYDPDLYLKLLDQCEVFGEDLVWVGEHNEQGVPVTDILGTKQNALSVFVYATYGKHITNTYETKCGFNKCINPFHVEIEDEISE